MSQEHPTPLSDEPWFEAMLTMWAELGILTSLVHELTKYSLTDKQLEDFIERFEANKDDLIGTVDVNGHDVPEYQNLVKEKLEETLQSLRRKTPGSFLSLFGFQAPR